MTPPTVSPGWRLPALVDALARAGWGILAGRQGGAVRSILRALAQHLPDGSATGLVTVPQIADMAGLGERWTRDTLGVLERAGIITWTRGGIIDGRPRPSIIRVNKRAIAGLVNDARRRHACTLRGRASSFARRLADELRTRTQIRRTTTPRRSPRMGAHAALSAALHPLRGKETGAPRPRLIDTTPRQSMLSPTWTPPPQPNHPRGRDRLRAALRRDH